MRKILGLLAVGILALSGWAAEVELHLFWSATCPDCHVMKAWLAELAQEYPELKIVEHEVTFEPDNWRL
ncbi:thioredoxin family protein, partial [Candidatus Bipolaricaulota bacterium]|nr:thioredoxin family protein [Candidatus Bipolaricaulota bacterium]